MESNHPIENLMKNTMENIKDMIDVNTIVGDAFTTPDGNTIIPISKVSFGFASGGTEFELNSTAEEGKDDYPFGGGSGAGVTVKPVAFLVTKNDTVRLLSVDHKTTYDKLIDNVPQIMDIVKGMIKKKSPEESNCSKEENGTNSESSNI